MSAVAVDAPAKRSKRKRVLVESKLFVRFPGSSKSLEAKWFTPAKLKGLDFLVSARTAADKGSHVMPCKTLKNKPDGVGAPEGQDPRMWAATMIYREHPLMVMLTHHKDPIRGIWYDDLCNILVEENLSTSQIATSRKLKDTLKLFASAVFPWLPEVVTNFFLPKADRDNRNKQSIRKGYRTEERQIFPVFLLPFLRIFFSGSAVVKYDAFITTMSGVLGGTAKHIPSAAFSHENAQFVVNMDMAMRGTNLLVALSETEKLRTQVIELTGTVKSIQVQQQRQGAQLRKILAAQESKKRRSSSSNDGSKRPSKRTREE